MNTKSEKLLEKVLDEKKRTALKKVLETGEITEAELEAVSGGDCQTCQTCQTNQNGGVDVLGV